MKKYIFAVCICAFVASCGTTDQRNPKMDNDPFENYVPWWKVWSTNNTSTNLVEKGK